MLRTEKDPRDKNPDKHIGPETVPSVVIRPHHLYFAEIRYALCRQQTPREIAYWKIASISLYVHRLHKDEADRYLQDLIGDQADGTNRYLLALEDFFTQLSELTDDQFILVDLDRDGLCHACAIGRHCQSANDGDYSFIELLLGEKAYASSLVHLLMQSGYRRDYDYCLRTTHHSLIDMQGKPFDDPIGGIKREFDFNAVLVRVGCLRELVQTFYFQERLID